MTLNTKATRLTRWMAVMAIAALSLIPAIRANAQEAQGKENDRLENSGDVLHDVLHIPDNIPDGLIDKARCVVILPSVIKGAFIFGGSYGRGTMVCRTGEDFRGPWGAPAMYALEGGSFGFQIGGQATDFIFL